MTARGKFITVEGIEGTGKSTNLEYVTGLIESRGFNVLRTREPGGTPMAEKIRQLLLDHDQEPVPDIAELLLFFAARSLHLHNTIVPALERGEWVVCDRFTDASRAYQGSGRGLDTTRIEKLADWVQNGLEPDMTLLLDAPADIGMARTAGRDQNDRMDDETLDFYERVRDGYLTLAGIHTDRFRVINADQPLPGVQAAIGAALEPLFDKKSP